MASPGSAPPFTVALPGWALPRGRAPDELAAAFAASIALKSLDDLVRSAPFCGRLLARAPGPQMCRRGGPADGSQRGRGGTARCFSAGGAGGDPGPAGPGVFGHQKAFHPQTRLFLERGGGASEFLHKGATVCGYGRLAAAILPAGLYSK